MKNISDEAIQLIMAGVIVLLIASSVVGFDVYRAGRQQKIYQAQGIEMSKWDIMLGCEPAQKAVTIKETKHEK